MPNHSHRPAHDREQKQVTYHQDNYETASEILSQTAISETLEDELYQNINNYQVYAHGYANRRITTLPSQNAQFSLDRDFVRYCQAYVSETSRPQSPFTMADSYYKRRGSCGGKCGLCIASTPALALTAMVMLIIGVSGCCGSFLVGVSRTRDWIDKSDTYLEFADLICVAVLCGMIFFSILFFVIATLLSNPNNKGIFNTTRKNTCAAILNVLVIVMLLLLFTTWIGVTILLAVPVMSFVLLHVLYKEKNIETIDLRNYAIYDESYVLSGTQLENFYDEGLDVVVCYSIALIGAILTTVSLCFFLMSASANCVHLREARFSVFNAYKPDITGSRISIVDTKM